MRSVYVVCAMSSGFARLHAEEVFFEKQVFLKKAQESKRCLEVELIFVEHELTRTEQRRRYRLLRLLNGGKFDRIVFGGDSFTPYLGDLRKAAPPHTEVLNKAEQNSTLDFFLQMFDYDRERSALE
jgi:hypothetical protein